MKLLKLVSFFFLIAVISQSCRKDSNEFIITPPIIEPEIKVVSSVLGIVIDDNGDAVEGATITFEDLITFTDENGVFQFNNEKLNSNGTFLKVTKNGFFDGSRKFYATERKTSRVLIELIPKKEVGEFISSDISTITFENVSLTFEANTIMNSDKSAYSGNVNVAAKYLDPTLIETLNQMPGDLTGTNTESDQVALTSMAMIAVELFDDNGNKLQVKDENTVDVKIPVPTSLLDDAPTTIPMWYFDEEVGSWIEEGFATLINGNYEAALPHFTFWNCDIPSGLVFLKGSIVNRDIPIQGANVVVSLANGGTSASTLTDGEGFFCGYVPAGEDLILEIYNKCGDVIYSLNIPASEEDILLDPINLYIEANLATVSGSVSLCNGVASPQTYINIRQGLFNNIVIINDDLTFSANVSYCDDNNDLLVRAVDPINALYSETLTFNVDNNIITGEIIICDEYILIDDRDGQQYLTVEIDGRVWTAENMRYDTDDDIPNGYDTIISTVPEHYGRYYNFKSAQLVCPDGWRLPSRAEYEELNDLYGNTAEPFMSIEDWIDDPNSTNSSGFNGYPTGLMNHNYTPPRLEGLGIATSFWTSTEETTKAYWFVLTTNNGIWSSYTSLGDLVESGSTVRCIQE